MKNKMMRIASVVMVAVIISVCAISGTFAKYVTSSEGSDTARVAKWGVVIDATADTLFKSQYETEDTSAELEGEYSVAVAGESEDKLVAPGTSGELASISISGTPEVAGRISFEATVELEGWEIEVESETVEVTEGESTDTAAAATTEFYCPLSVTVGEETLSGLDFESADEFAEAIQALFTDFSADYDPNTDLSTVDAASVSVSWEWAFEGDDAKDTALGDAAAAGTDSTISISFSVTATQID